MEADVKNMTYVELVMGWHELRVAAPYHNELRFRAFEAQQDFVTHLTANLWAELDAATPEEDRSSPEDDPERSLVRSIRTGDTINNGILTILNSGWDYVDPKGYMHKTPAEVENFLRDLLSGFPENYNEIHPSRRSLLKMICDSWFRWADQ